MPLARERQSHLPCIKDLDSLDLRSLAPTGGLAFGQHTAFCPFGVAASRDALGPELARRARGEMDHDAMRVDVTRATALVHFAVSIGGLELDAHELLRHEIAGSAEPMASLASARNYAALRAEVLRFLVAWPRLSDLLL